jgi:DNA invertase Pin-like site-specific DNA recombinase
MVKVYKIDRLARSLIDLLSILDRIQKAGAAFQSLTEQVDTSTSAGRMMTHMLGAFAEFERGII